MVEEKIVNKETPENLPSALHLTHAVYALQAISFLPGVTYLIAVIGLIINYVKWSDVQGTWLESHFRWQVRTFWFSLLWVVLGFLTIFIFIGFIILLADYIWVIYRVIKGWLLLKDHKPISTDASFRF